MDDKKQSVEDAAREALDAPVLPNPTTLLSAKLYDTFSEEELKKVTAYVTQAVHENISPLCRELSGELGIPFTEDDFCRMTSTTSVPAAVAADPVRVLQLRRRTVQLQHLVMAVTLQNMIKLYLRGDLNVMLLKASLPVMIDDELKLHRANELMEHLVAEVTKRMTCTDPERAVHGVKASN